MPVAGCYFSGIGRAGCFCERLLQCAYSVDAPSLALPFLQRGVGGKSLEQLLDEFARLRKENLLALQSLKLQPKDFDRHGRHPALGVVTLSQLLATWAAHDLTHLHQLSRVMAHQYRDAVGPWSAYLGVLQCAGHSSP